MLDKHGHLSLIDLAKDSPVLEVIDDNPATSSRSTADGFVVLDTENNELYAVNRMTKSVTSISLGLPTITVSVRELRVGANVFAGNIVASIGVGIKVTESEIALGGSLPPRLDALRV